MVFFAGGRPGFCRGRPNTPDAARSPVPDANPGTFYSAMSNIDIEIEDGNSGAVAVRARYAQHCFLAHMDFRLGTALAGIHEGGNVVEDVRFIGGNVGIWTSKPSPGWQITVIDSTFEGQREAAIREREAGLTLIRPHFLRVPTAVSIEPGWTDELWVKDARLEDISGPAFIFGVEKNPRNEINMEGIACRSVPVFASLRDSGRKFEGPGTVYGVKVFSHGLRYEDIGAAAKNRNHIRRLLALIHAGSSAVGSPSASRWHNMGKHPQPGRQRRWHNGRHGSHPQGNRHPPRHLLPMGFYIVRDTLLLKSDTMLIGLHPGASQIILPDGTTGISGCWRAESPSRVAQRWLQYRHWHWALHQRDKSASSGCAMEGWSPFYDERCPLPRRPWHSKAGRLS